MINTYLLLLGQSVALGFGVIIACAIWMYAINKTVEALGWSWAVAGYALRTTVVRWMVGRHLGKDEAKQYYCPVCDERRPIKVKKEQS